MNESMDSNTPDSIIKTEEITLNSSNLEITNKDTETNKP